MIGRILTPPNLALMELRHVCIDRLLEIKPLDKNVVLINNSHVIFLEHETCDSEAYRLADLEASLSQLLFYYMGQLAALALNRLESQLQRCSNLSLFYYVDTDWFQLFAEISPVGSCDLSLETSVLSIASEYGLEGLLEGAQFDSKSWLLRAFSHYGSELSHLSGLTKTIYKPAPFGINQGFHPSFNRMSSQ